MESQKGVTVFICLFGVVLPKVSYLVCYAIFKVTEIFIQIKYYCHVLSVRSQQDSEKDVNF